MAESSPSILVRAPNWIGDQILAYPFFHFLRAARPGARITVACAPWVEDVQFRHLVDEVIPLEKPEGSGFWPRFRAIEKSAAQLRGRTFDLGITLPNSVSSAWYLFRAGAKVRRGYRADGRGVLLTESVKAPLHIVHRAESYLDLLPSGIRAPREALEFWGVPAANELDPGLPGIESEFDAARAWPQADLVEPPDGDYWVVAPGANAEARRWPVERYVELCRRVNRETGARAVIVGGLAEVRLAMRISEELGSGVLDRTAQGPVSCLWKLFRRARFTVTNDSGLAHVASLCGSKVQIIWGAGDPKRTQPIGPGKVRILFNPVDCWPCEQNTCRMPAAQKIQCLKGISPDAVWDEMKSGLKPL